jgi:mono/diheme cytochrome c family protein
MKYLAALLALCTLLSLGSCEPKPYKQGKALYEKNCQSCHQPDGSAIAQLVPPLAGSDVLSQGAAIACIIRNGLQGSIRVNGVEYNQPMPSNELLSEIQIANILNYINNSWGNSGSYISYQMVNDALKRCNN